MVRPTALSSAILVMLFIAVDTEVLGALNLITPGGIAGSWVLFVVVLSVLVYRKRLPAGKIWRASLQRAQLLADTLGRSTLWITLTILFLTLLVALVAPTNNQDGLSYHVSRLQYWIQNSNVGHYASHTERAISFSPFSEYCHLHTLLLTGSGRFFQLLQWLSLVGGLGVLSLITRQLTTSRTALRVSLCFAVTIPIVILESMTTQNDLISAFFVIMTTYYCLRYLHEPRGLTLLLIATTVGLGILTKGTFLFFAAPFGVYLVVKLAWAKQFRQVLTIGLSVGLIALALNLPFWYRTYELTGSPIGTMNMGNRNERHDPVAVLSSVSKNVVLHLGFVSPGDHYNNFLQKQLTSFHHLLGMELNAYGMGMEFKMNRLNFNEDFAHNFIAAWMIILCLIILPFRRKAVAVTWYMVLTCTSFLLFSIFISYQHYGSRLHIPFFLLMSPLMGIVLSGTAPWVTSGIRWLLWIAALPFALLSITHPLLSTKWFFTDVFPIVNKVAKMNIDPAAQNNLMQESVLFNDNEEIVWGILLPELKSMQQFVDSIHARKIGFYFLEGSLDYGYQYMLQKPGRTFHHVEVANASKVLENHSIIPDCIISEIDTGPEFICHGQHYVKRWAREDRWIYVKP